ncbi:MAG: acyl-CoA dehydrogenase family protein [Acidimicrobiia bacterium]|nr:acyl-CoA dehydrogenase family protein [Acidimicrobiia bacterium]
MDFNESTDHARFRHRARAWLESVSEPAREAEVPSSAIVAEWSPAEEAAKMADARAWQRTKFDAGWAGITWPVEYGGRGGTTVESVIFAQEESARDVPRGALTVGLGWLGPMLLTLGTPAQKERYIRPMLRGDEVWCQLFSEPGAGSDLAGLATTATRDGDEWRLTGQKVWTTFGHMSDHAIVLARTDPDVPKHRGISAFVLDMDQPGVEVRPLRQMTGAQNFNEVFLDGAVVRGDQIVGGVGDGWRCAMVTFMHERSGGSGAEVGISKLVDLVAASPLASDRVVRQELMRCYTGARTLAMSAQRILSAVLAGGAPGPEGSTMKLAYTNLTTRMADLALAVQGPAAMLYEEDAPVDGGWQAFFLGMPGIRIGGGTDDIQRNIIGERVLGLPGDIRVDKDVAWRDVPRSG